MKSASVFVSDDSVVSFTFSAIAGELHLGSSKLIAIRCRLPDDCTESDIATAMTNGSLRFDGRVVTLNGTTIGRRD